MLNKLGGKTTNIDLLVIELKRWYQSERSTIQLIGGDLMRKQPFEQILIFYQCNENQPTMHRVYLTKIIRTQERSTCPSQIRVLRNFDEFERKDQINSSAVFISHKEKREQQHHSGLISKVCQLKSSFK